MPNPRVLYHCPCALGLAPSANAGSTTSSSSATPLLPSQLAASSYSFHPLPLLHFCSDCLTPRCSLCATQEVITHYCPACLFEVPSASVKAERNRCPRNCFLCPQRGCGAYLSVVASDPAATGMGRLEAPESSVGRPPYFLSCARCKWDSRAQGQVFEKPTGVSAQLEAQRGPHPLQEEMDRLRSHFESFLRKQQQPQGTATTLPPSASSRKLVRDIPGLGDPATSKYLAGSRRGGGAALGLSGPLPPAATEDLPAYRSEGAALSRQVEQEALARHAGPSLSPGLHSTATPARVPLTTKKTLRCPTCRHILIKPDPKATSHRWKIKLSALNYLPEVGCSFRGARHGAGAGVGAGMEHLARGGEYEYELAVRNPLEEAIRVRLTTGGGGGHGAVAQGWNARLSTSRFTVKPFDDVVDVIDSDLLGLGRGDEEDDEAGFEDVEDIEEGQDNAGDGKQQQQQQAGSRGVIRRKGNETVVALRLSVGAQASGEVEVPLRVTFSYRVEPGQSEEPGEGQADEKGTRSLSFWIALRLGKVAEHEARGAGKRAGEGEKDEEREREEDKEQRLARLRKRRSEMTLMNAPPKVV
ncbi:hypothetical protein BDZ90DRAFT_230163 [Jaminaea rosea]|uniref:Dynactin subunit 4 n=1 Tax=Jaminaea rosea TaxID=1569628 RepID=A0A316UVD0_9BASI|nr:hypothetical protein BDZ90DRAFT_230163 [Jaminaea rosea]PWN29266.1 hypothetical protein BDZ90DRAFT_230163 [Jaminaea rosea]